MRTLTARLETVLVLSIMAAASAIRVGVALRNPIPAGDGVASELEMARNLIDGRGFSTQRKWMLSDPSLEGIRPEGNRQPAMSCLLVPVFLAGGASFRSAQVLSLVLGLSAMLSAWLWARRTFGRIEAIAALAWLALDPVMIWFSTQPDSLMLFTALFFLVLAAGSGREPSLRFSILSGLLCGAAYLARTQGMVFALSIGLWILVRGGRRRLECAAAFSTVFLACALPWFMRNADAFGSPLYTQNRQFLLNENHWAAWEVRDTPPGPADMLRHQGPAAVAAAVLAGTLRVLEPLTTGTLHRGEVFGWPSMMLFAVLSLVALGDPAMRRRMILPAFAALPTTASLVLHEHPGRYLTFLVVVVVCLGIASAARISERLGLGTKTRLAIAALAFLPLARPLHALAASDSRARASEAAAISRWISRNSEPDEWVVTFPNVELLIWDYRRPTLTMPDDYEALLWPCLQKHGVRFVVVDPDLPAARPWLSTRWTMAPDGSGWERLDPPPFLHEVHRSASGRTIVYEWSGTVPEGFMAVDSLPRDNCRALPPR